MAGRTESEAARVRPDAPTRRQAPWHRGVCVPHSDHMGDETTQRSGRPAGEGRGEHVHQRRERGGASERWEECRECGHRDPTVRDLGLTIRYGLCDPCFADLVAVRTLNGPLPLARILDDLGAGVPEPPGDQEPADPAPAPRPPRPARAPDARHSAEP